MRAVIGVAIMVLGGLHALYYALGMAGGWAKDGWNLLQFAAGLVAAGIGYGVVRWRHRPLSPSLRWLVRIAIAAVCLIGLITGYTLFWILTEGISEDRPADYVIVLGAGVRGETPSRSLQERLELALQYADRYPDTLLILSGGRGPGEAITEAEAMKRYLLGRGIPEERLLLEDRSTTTYENLLFSKSMLESRRVDPSQATFMIVTNDFHLYRAKFLAERLGLAAHGLAAPTPPSTIPRSYLRECVAVWKTWLLGR